MTLLDGKSVAKNEREKLKQAVENLKTQGHRAPALAVILVGDDPASHIYVDHKIKACTSVGVTSKPFILPEKTTHTELMDIVHKLNHDPNVDGILVQLPLPKHMDTREVIHAINPAKDVDGFHPENLGRLAANVAALRPCTPYGVMALLHHYLISVSGLTAVVVGASNIVGRPMMLELLNAGATVTICHQKTKDLAAAIKGADLIVSAVGKPKLIETSWLKKGCIAIDIGITRLPSGKLAGDFDFDTAKDIASHITPVPGGVGPMTVAMLLKNTITAYEQRS